MKKKIELSLDAVIDLLLVLILLAGYLGVVLDNLLPILIGLGICGCLVGFIFCKIIVGFRK